MATTATGEASLHDEALQAEKHLEALATGLGQVGASPATIKAVSQMAEVTRQIVSALGKGQEDTGDEEPSSEAQPTPHDTIGQAAGETGEAMQASAAK